MDFPLAGPWSVQYNDARYDPPGNVSSGIRLYEKITGTGKLRHGQACSATSNPVKILSRRQAVLNQNQHKALISNSLGPIAQR